MLRRIQHQGIRLVNTSLGVPSRQLLSSSSDCWKCEKPEATSALFCKSCDAIQPLETEGCDLFALFSMDQTFMLNEAQLEASFKDLQKVLHPDKFATKSLQERDASATASSTVNQAYQMLRDPVERARYLLQRHGSSVLDEGGDSIQDPALMMEMFSIRESVENATSIEVLREVQENVQVEVDAACVALQQCLDQKMLYALPHAAVRLKYYSKVMEEIQAREEADFQQD
jgi:molecular chaperone HscB